MRKQAAAVVAAVGALAVPAVAQGHVTLHPNVLPAGSFPEIDVRVPNEEDKADTTKVDVQFPPGFLDVSTAPVPGWTAKVITRKLPKPVKDSEGNTVTEEVAQVVWTGGKLAPGEFLDFPVSTSMPDDAVGKTLTFKAIQTYSDGTIVRWIGPPSADKPAPTVDVSAKGGQIQDVAGGESGPGPLPSGGSPAKGTKAKATESKRASKGLGIAALIVGILGLLAALVALALARRPRRGVA